MTLNPDEFYEIEINETNIDRYDIPNLRNQSREDLLNRAAEAAKEGYTVSVKLPRVDVDRIDRTKGFNVFDYVDTEHIDPARIKSCGYALRQTEDGQDVYICVLHGKISMYDVEKRPSAPCIQVDPDVKPTKEQMDLVVGCRYEIQQHPLKGTIHVCVLHNAESKHDVTRFPNNPCLVVDPMTPSESDPSRP